MNGINLKKSTSHRNHKFQEIIAVLGLRKMFVMLLLGFSSGLPLLLTLSTLAAWYTQAGIETKDIGFLSLISVPYTFKFLWAPLMDRFSLPFLGRRKGWILLMQILLIIFVFSNGFFTPNEHPWILATLNFIIVFLSATQDININAYQADILKPNERALGGAISTLGYRVAMFISGGGSLLLAATFSWSIAFFVIALLFIIGIFATLIAPNPQNEIQHTPKSLYDAVIFPFLEFFNRYTKKTAIFTLFIIIFYKLGDQLAFALNTTFFLRGLGFSLTEVAIAFKISALIFTLLGTLTGGIIIRFIGVFKGLLYFSFIMALANLMYMILALTGKNFMLMTISVAIEYFAGGLGSSAFLAFLFSLCNQNYSATQFALFSSLDSLGRVFIGPFAGFIAEYLGWASLFLTSTIIGIIVSISLIFSHHAFSKMTNEEAQQTK